MSHSVNSMDITDDEERLLKNIEPCQVCRQPAVNFLGGRTFPHHNGEGGVCLGQLKPTGCGA